MNRMLSRLALVLVAAAVAFAGLAVVAAGASATAVGTTGPNLVQEPGPSSLDPRCKLPADRFLYVVTDTAGTVSQHVRLADAAAVVQPGDTLTVTWRVPIEGHCRDSIITIALHRTAGLTFLELENQPLLASMSGTLFDRLPGADRSTFGLSIVIPAIPTDACDDGQVNVQIDTAVGYALDFVNPGSRYNEPTADFDGDGEPDGAGVNRLIAAGYAAGGFNPSTCQEVTTTTEQATTTTEQATTTTEQATTTTTAAEPTTTTAADPDPSTTTTAAEPTTTTAGEPDPATTTTATDSTPTSEVRSTPTPTTIVRLTTLPFTGSESDLLIKIAIGLGLAGGLAFAARQTLRMRNRI